MDREDFIERVAAKTGLSPSDAGKAVEAFMETFTETLNGDAANLKGAKDVAAGLTAPEIAGIAVSALERAASELRADARELEEGHRRFRVAVAGPRNILRAIANS